MDSLNDTLYINGGRPLEGEYPVQTAKNSTLYLMLGALLTPDEVVLEDIPKLSDVLVLQSILEHFGANVSWEGSALRIHAPEIYSCDAPYGLVSKMRASFVAMGALLARCGEARISMPGGCAFGPRPVDRHIRAFRDLGVDVDEGSGDFVARRLKPLQGRTIFAAPTVGGTQNVILASALGEGEVVIENAALEPEIQDLADMLNAMGADIRGADTGEITIRGVARLHGTRYRPVPDRIEAGTVMLAAAATRGRVTLRDVRPEHLRSVTAKLVESGVRVFEIDARSLVVDARPNESGDDLHAVDVTALEYPGVPTDLQAPFGAYLATVRGRSVVSDRVYPDRFTHAAELQRAGARMELNGDVLAIDGGALVGARMAAADIRAGGALIVAALAADGPSEITGLQFIERGYEDVVRRFGALGADIRRESGPAVLATGTHGD
jgi:UDP-N-acetylglucosamine 1-carboxyvinyltransferase